MTKQRRLSAITLAMTLPFLFVACATEAPQEQPLKPELTAPSRIEPPPLPPASAASKTVEPPHAVEELPAITEERTVFFSLGSATLTYKAKQKLETIAERLAADRHLHVSLLGYANDNGSRSFNLAVSDNRVTAVADFLRKNGVQNGQIRTQALGSEKVSSNCRSSKCREQFRRVDLVITQSK